MTEQEKINISIHEFMDGAFWAYKGNSSYKTSFKTYNECLEAIEKNNWLGYAPEIGWGLKYGNYHSSWDALMPVVQKIVNADMDSFDSYALWVSDSLRTADIKQVYQAVYNYIESRRPSAEYQSFISKQPTNQE